MHKLVFLISHSLLFLFSFVFPDQSLLDQRPDKTDIAVIMYTSGSTGTPKGYFSLFTKQSQWILLILTLDLI